MKPAAFIDFQGTLGGEGTGDIRSLHLFPFAAQALRALNEAGIPAIGITNQSHIAKGEMTWGEYETSLAALKEELRSLGARLDAVYCCPHRRADNCRCKKPLPGMVEDACRDFPIDLGRSYVVGDMGKSDMALAHCIGAKGILVLTGVGGGSLGAFRHTWAGIEPFAVCDTLLDAVTLIIKDLT